MPKKKINDPEMEPFTIDNIVYIPLNGRGKLEGAFAMISKDKYHIVTKHKWYLGKSGYPVCYELGKMQLHRFIYTIIIGGQLPSNLYVDHIDRNKLNNVDNNLRLATPQENSFNKSTDSNKKGVRKISENNYTACAVKNGIRHEIKNIPTQQQAAEIYNLMAEELYGHFASLNNINNIDNVNNF
ncbi:putative HNH endonuclease [Cotonvirus japonicus]|uniref:HNH endonuclease n=1 Tax=Cotonvirus japonicus TaxID=2811091 RepID=A0ABM7NT66_9VIRU|nr:putative HNH endonuclease [Cotonvirus japonicus]BCS83362.1 putative HNH endonuclease [Cotonvirus japonicus]